MHRAAPFAVLFLLVVSSAGGDTIVLKNGQRIVASDITEHGDQVTYETPAGEMSIPKSIVARIERDDLSYASASSRSSVAPVAAPRVQLTVPGYEEIASQTVHDGSIDFAYIARLESDAGSGSAMAIDKVAAAQYAAAQFLVSQGDTSDAIDHYHQALVFAPDNVGLLLNLAVLYLRESQFKAALDPLEHARSVTSDSSPAAADIAKLEGWAYYGANNLARAIEQWKLAERWHPEPDVEQALEKAEQDQSTEKDYREGESAHFVLEYSGSEEPELAREILHALEDDFNDLATQLDYTPPDQIAVILYTDQAFVNITRAPSWVGALNDGRIRIPVQGLTSVTPELAHELKHELTHSFVGQKTHGRAPTWLQEGIAQYMEGRRSDASAAVLLDAAENGMAPSLPSLEGSWMGLSGNSAAFAYAWSLAVVESIIDAGGVSDISRLLDRVATAPSTEDACRETLHSDYSDLQRQTIDYLRREYVR